MSSEENTGEQEQEQKQEVVPGFVTGMLPWYWKSLPSAVTTATAVASSTYAKLKSSLPIGTEALDAAERRVLFIVNISVEIVDKSARAMDVKITPLIEESQLRSWSFAKVQQYIISQWKRREELKILAVEKTASTLPAQLSLRFVDFLFSILEKWNITFQRYVTSSRRWIRRIRRSGLPKDSDEHKIVSPRKRVKFSQTLRDLLTSDTTPNCSKNELNGESPSSEDHEREEEDRKTSEDEHPSPAARKTEVDDEVSDDFLSSEVHKSDEEDGESFSKVTSSSPEDRKRKADEVCSESDNSVLDPDYEPDESSSCLESLEFGADEQEISEDEGRRDGPPTPLSPVDTYGS